jgi:hypothetical protein
MKEKYFRFGKIGIFFLKVRRLLMGFGSPLWWSRGKCILFFQSKMLIFNIFLQISLILKVIQGEIAGRSAASTVLLNMQLLCLYLVTGRVVNVITTPRNYA